MFSRDCEFLYSRISLGNVYFIILRCYFHIPSANFSTKRIKVLSGEITQLIWPKMGTWMAIDRKTGQRRVVLAYEILFLLFGITIVCSYVMNDIFQSLTTCTLIIKQVLSKYSESYIFDWHSKFTNCLTWLKVDVLPYHVCRSITTLIERIHLGISYNPSTNVRKKSDIIKPYYD